MSDSDNELDKIKRDMKRKKKKLAVPEEFLDNAKSYEDKLGLVKILTEKEKGRVLRLISSACTSASLASK